MQSILFDLDSYPTPKQYSEMIDAILTKWPHLAHEKNLSVTDATVCLALGYS